MRSRNRKLAGAIAGLLGAAVAGSHSPVVAWSQQLQQGTVPAASLPAPEQQVIDRLGELDHLPDGEWRVHSGDMPHGEDPELDQSDWPAAAPGQSFPNGSVWFRQWVEVPALLHGYDLTGTKIWFSFRAGGSGPVTEIVYFNGRRVAMGESLEPILLFDDARPGQKVLVAVKLLATVDQKRFIGSTEHIDFAPTRPDPKDVREELLSAALLLPTLSQNLTSDRSTLDKAIGQVDLRALDTADQLRFDSSLETSVSTLAGLKPVLHRATVLLTGNSHIDAAWLWPRVETVDTVRRTFSTALQLMNEYPGYTYTQSAAQYNDWMAEDYPEINGEIAKRIQEGRWEVVGGMWVEPDLNVPDGESTVRSLLIGKRWFQKTYGVDVRVGWNPDSFGYNWQLPQIYKQSGIDYFVTQKMSWNDTNQLPLKLFWWESPDGSKVLTYFPHGYANRTLDPVRLSADLVSARKEAPGLTEMMDLYGVGDHGGGPTRAMLDEGLHWLHQDKIAPEMQFGTAQTYLSSVEKTIAPDSRTWNYRSIANGYEYPPQPNEGQTSIPTWDDELYLEFHRGVYTTQAQMKRNLRQGPESTLNAEKYASLAWLDGDSYPGDELTDNWKAIAFNDFHDLAAGSGIGVIYKDAEKDFQEVYRSDREIGKRALSTIAAHVNTRTGAGVPVFVFNPLAWQRSDLVSVDVQLPAAAREASVLDAANHVLPSQVLSKDAGTSTFHLLVAVRNVPSVGYQILHVVPGRQAFPSDLRVQRLTLENAALRVVVDSKNGCITSLYNRRARFETLAAGSCGNELQAFNDLPKRYDAWNIDPGTLDQIPQRLTQVDSVETVEKGPLRGIIRVTRTWQHSKFVQDIVLYAGSDQVYVINDIDWHETHVLLKAAFTLSAAGPFATYEIPFGTIERPTTRNNSWEKARFEVPAQNWADLGDAQHGFSLINDSKYGYDAAGNVLRLTLLRSPVWPDPNADRGSQHFTYVLYPHGGSWKQALTVRHGYEVNFPLTAMQVEQHTGTMPNQRAFLSVEPENVVLAAIKKAEDSNALILHLYEWAGKSASVEIVVPPGATNAAETNLIEQRQGSSLPIHGNHIVVPIRPYQIVAIRIDYQKHD